MVTVVVVATIVAMVSAGVFAQSHGLVESCGFGFVVYVVILLPYLLMRWLSKPIKVKEYKDDDTK